MALNDRYDYEVMSCVVEKDGKQVSALATLVPFEGGYELLFPLEPPYTVLLVNGAEMKLSLNNELIPQ